MSEHSTIDYVEFPSRDLEATKAFFAAAFGWSFEDYGPDYASFLPDTAGLAGGFFRGAAGARTATGSALVVIYSSELEETLREVVEAGGSVEKDIFSFPGGQRFHFIEPGGNEFAVWSE